MKKKDIINLFLSYTLYNKLYLYYFITDMSEN